MQLAILIIGIVILALSWVSFGLLLFLHHTHQDSCPPQRTGDYLALQLMLKHNKDLTIQIFAFHSAARTMVDMEVKLAGAEVAKKDAETRLEVAKADRLVAELSNKAPAMNRSVSQASILMEGTGKKTDESPLRQDLVKRSIDGHSRIEMPSTT